MNTRIIKSSILSLAISMSSIALAQNNPDIESVAPGYTGELTINGDIVMEQSLSKISDELEDEVTGKLKKDYIIFHKHIWNTLPKADYLYSLYRVQKDNYRNHLFLNTLFDRNNNAMISTLNFTNFEIEDTEKTSITDILKFGIAPSLFPKGVTKLEIDNMKITHINALSSLKNSYEAEIKIRGKEYLSYFIFEEIQPGAPIRVFSITRPKQEDKSENTPKVKRKNTNK